MQRRFFALSALWLLSASAHAQPAAVSPQDILAASDAVRNPDFSFSLTNTLVEYRQGKQTDSSQLTVYSRPDSASGQFRNLARYQAPARDAGKLLLFSGKELWFYDPASKASIRLSPQQKLLGQASNSDVVTVNLARDYHATEAQAQQIQDGARATRDSIQLTLKPTSPEASYARIVLWVSANGYQPIKGRFYADSGALLKTAYYRRYEPIFGVQRPTETVIIDGLDPTWVTIMRYSDWVRRDVPQAWLQRDYLPQFHPE